MPVMSPVDQAIEKARDDRARYHGGRQDGVAHMHDKCLMLEGIDNLIHGMKVMQDNWPGTIPAPMDKRRD